jgi:hypothetical protein
VSPIDARRDGVKGWNCNGGKQCFPLNGKIHAAFMVAADPAGRTIDGALDRAIFGRRA